MIEQTKGKPHELFGFDLMIDTDFNCWLIEVNSSPAMDLKTPGHDQLCKMVLEDTVKVVVDYGCEPNLKKRKEVSTGLYECIYRAERIVERPLNSYGLNMEITGTKVKEAHLKLI